MTASAAEAWVRLTGTAPDRVDVLKRTGDTVVCRLHGANGAAIIAKRCPRETAAVERIVYEQCLKGLALPVLHWYGAIEEPGHSWLFVEHAAGARFHADKPGHRQAAARWLAALHASVRGRPAPQGLPGRRPEHYRQVLDAELEMLAGDHADPAVDALTAQCRRVASCWSELEAACADAPDTLVHGDLVAHNVRLRESAAGVEFLPFDWEKAGWGAAAEDISIADLDVYSAALGTQRDAALDRLAGAGRIFRCLVYLRWVRPALSTDRAAGLAGIRQCTSWIEHLLERAPWR